MRRAVSTLMSEPVFCRIRGRHDVVHECLEESSLHHKHWCSTSLHNKFMSCLVFVWRGKELYSLSCMLLSCVFWLYMCSPADMRPSHREKRQVISIPMTNLGLCMCMEPMIVLFFDWAWNLTTGWSRKSSHVFLITKKSDDRRTDATGLETEICSSFFRIQISHIHH